MTRKRDPSSFDASVMNSLSLSDIDNALMSGLSRKDLFRLSQTSRDLRDRVDKYMKRASNIENFLRKYFTPSEVAGFRSLQSRTQMLIAGSTALQFFERVEYPNSDLDVYVEHDRKEEIVAWLLRIGYLFEPRCDRTLAEEMSFPPHVFSFNILNDPSYIGRGIANVYNFHKYNPERKIQLITSNRSPLETVLSYHSTCVMNIITHEKAYALYPNATFVDRRSLKYSTSGVNQEEARQKYADRGWTMVDCLATSELEDKNSEFTAAARYAGDSFCWTIDLLPKMALPEALVEINSWEFCCKAESSSMEMWSLAKDKLSFKYLIANYETYDFIKLSLYFEAAGEQHDAKILELLRARRISQ